MVIVPANCRRSAVAPCALAPLGTPALPRRSSALSRGRCPPRSSTPTGSSLRCGPHHLGSLRLTIAPPALGEGQPLGVGHPKGGSEAMSRAVRQTPEERWGHGSQIDCPECGTTAWRWVRGGERAFCSPACRLSFNARAKVEGASVITLAKAWRKARGSGELGKACFAELTTILDELNARDHDEGKPDIRHHAARLLARGRHIDRRRRKP
jgi:hypothetical protein